MKSREALLERLLKRSNHVSFIYAALLIHSGISKELHNKSKLTNKIKSTKIMSNLNLASVGFANQSNLRDRISGVRASLEGIRC